MIISMPTFMEFVAKEMENAIRKAVCLEVTDNVTLGGRTRQFRLKRLGFGLFDDLSVRSFRNGRTNVTLSHIGEVESSIAEELATQLATHLGPDSNDQLPNMEELANEDYCWYFDKDGQLLPDVEYNDDVSFGVFLALHRERQMMKIIGFDRFPTRCLQ